MAMCTIFNNFSTKVENKSIHDILKDITSPRFKDQVENIRELISKGRIDEASRKKQLLQAFTPCGTFDNGRKAEKITTYNGIIILDFDKVGMDHLNMAINKVKQIPFTYASFISPSGNGFKVMVRVDDHLDSHIAAFKDVSSYYQNILNIQVDASGKDVSRLCFMSYDPDCFYNQHSLIFQLDKDLKSTYKKEVSPEQPDHMIKLSNEDNDFESKFNECIKFTDKKSQYINGNRNNYIHTLACNCNRLGIPESNANEMIINNFDLNPAEITSAVHSAYTNNVADFAKFANIAKPANIAINNVSINDPEIDYLKSTPTIPLQAIQMMPILLQEGARAFESDPRKRDVFITSALCIISGCLPNIEGVYDQERVHPHLFSFIIAPAASGKGVLKNAKRLGDKIHERLVETSKQAKDQFDNEMVDYKGQLSKRKKDDPIPEKPQEPAFKLLFIPADCSQAMMMQILQDNHGMGIICETEADAMSGANKQDWGNYSHIMRAAFHHEKISAARKTNREILEIKRPKLAVALSGTPAQVPKLIASAEDGLFSRFMFYAFKSEIIWRDPSPRPGGIIYNDHFEALSNEMVKIVDFLNKYPTEIFLTLDQWEILNSAFVGKLNDVAIFTGEEAAGVVYRLGLVMFRICMVFTSLRKFENGDCSKDVTCTDDDFQAALILSDLYLQHSLLMFNNLSDNKEPILYKMPNNKRLLLEKLPHEFPRKEAITLGHHLGLSQRAVDDFLNNSIPMFLEKPKTGFYRKVI
jgi:hypothetical protein